ncbi:MAG TPA: DoxX family protein [Thermoanaerobaculia bacterium]|jgi:hypothetical protein|nr:DoxX family protein [Thermoanaerobaculia bacterium]
MQTDVSAPPVSKAALWTGRIISGILALLLFWSAALELVRPSMVMEGMTKYGYSAGSVLGIGLALLAGVILYVVPRTSILGAIVLTGYLGGAVSTHVRAGDPVGRMLVPVLFGVLIWGGLYLRDPWLRGLVPLRRPAARPGA